MLDQLFKYIQDGANPITITLGLSTTLMVSNFKWKRLVIKLSISLYLTQNVTSTTSYCLPAFSFVSETPQTFGDKEEKKTNHITLFISLDVEMQRQQDSRC